MTDQASPSTTESAIATPSAPSNESPISPATSSPTGGQQTLANGPLSGETSNDPDEQFAGLGEEFDALVDLPIPTTTKPAAAPAPTAPVAPATSPATVAAPSVQSQPSEAPAPASAVPGEPKKDAAAAAETGTEVQAGSVDEALSAIQNMGGEIFQQVVSQFALSPEQVTELETDAVAAVPKLLASSYIRSVQTSLAYMKQMVPTIIQRYMAEDAMARAAESEFFSQWKSLDRAKHGEDIRSFAKMFHQANPKISRKDLFSMVGSAVMAKHGIAAAIPTPPPASVSPAVPGFAPAAAGAPIVHSTPILDENPFMGLGREFDNS